MNAKAAKAKRKNPPAWRRMTTRRNHSHTSCQQPCACVVTCDRPPTLGRRIPEQPPLVLIQISYACAAWQKEHQTMPDRPDCRAIPPPIYARMVRYRQHPTTSIATTGVFVAARLSSAQSEVARAGTPGAARLLAAPLNSALCCIAR